MIRYIRDWQHRRDIKHTRARLAVTYGKPAQSWLLQQVSTRSASAASVEHGRAQSAEEDR